MNHVKSLPVAALTLWLLGLGQAVAADPLGTVGHFRSFGVKNCGKPINEQLQGACDPPAVAESLSGRERAEAHLKRARALMSFLRLEQAYAAVVDALNADPKNIEAMVFRVRLAMSQAAWEATNRDLNAGLLAAPDNPFLLATRAEIVLENGDPKAALRDVSAALERQPDDVDMLWIRARARVELDQFEDAKKDFDRALQLEPDNNRVLLSRAQLYLRRGEFEHAISDTSELLALRPGDISGRETRAISYAALGRNAEAVDDLNVILGKPGEPSAASPIFTQFSRLLLQRAILLVRLNRPAEANLDLDAIMTTGGKRALLRMQVYLRKNGFADLRIDGQRTAAFDSALEACFINQACGRGLVRSL